MRFGIRNLLLVVAAAAVACGLFVAARNLFFADRRQVYAVLAEVKGISNFELHSHIDVIEEINHISVSVDSHPDSIIELVGLGNDGETGRFFISRIAQWRFVVSGQRFMGVTDAVSGKPVESEYLGGHIELGPTSPYQALIPFEVKTLQDVVDHYQDLVDLFESWSREADPGQVILEDGSIQYFYVVGETK